MKDAITIARANSTDDLNKRIKVLETYAQSAGFNIVKTIARVGMSAKEAIGLLADFVRQHSAKIVIVDDRLYRNWDDVVLVEDMIQKSELEIHSVGDGQVLRKGSVLNALLGRIYIDHLSEEIIKGQLAKAEKGQYPGRSPYGYSYDEKNRTIMPETTSAKVIKLLFAFCAEGTYSASELQKAVLAQTGERISNARLARILRSRFYCGVFNWSGREYQGTHTPLVDVATFDLVQTIMSATEAKKKRKGEDK